MAQTAIYTKSDPLFRLPKQKAGTGGRGHAYAYNAGFSPQRHNEHDEKQGEMAFGTDLSSRAVLCAASRWELCRCG